MVLFKMITFNTSFLETNGSFPTTFSSQNDLLQIKTWSGQTLKVGKVISNTTAGWNSQSNLIAEKNTIYVYSDYQIIDGKTIAGMKIGDGTSYLIDMPFTDSGILEHINNSIIHVSANDREKWNNKVSVYIDTEDEENIVFTTD